MGKYKNGITGPFTGRIGPVIGSSWNGIPYMKSLPIRTKKATEGEKANRARFKIAQEWLSPLLNFVREGFKGYTPTVQGFIAAKSYLMKNAMEGTGTESKVIPSKMLVSYGDLPLSENISATLLENNQLQFMWNTEKIEGTNNYDQVMLLAYDDDYNRTSPRMRLTGQFRYVGSDILELPNRKGRSWHVYLAFLAHDRSKQSNSVYLGTVTT